jgi:hypothetical protein
LGIGYWVISTSSITQYPIFFTRSSNQLQDGIPLLVYGQGFQSMTPLLWRSSQWDVISSKLFYKIAEFLMDVKHFAKFA